MERIWIKRAIIGSTLIAIVVAGLGFASYKWAKQYYYDELENQIEDLYLEGKDAIGFYDFSSQISTELYSNEYQYTYIDYMDLLENKKHLDPNVRGWPSNLVSLYGQDYTILASAGIFTNPIYTELANSEKFAWWIAVNPLNKFVILKKTKQGFDFIDEYIMGIGFKYLPPCTTHTDNLLIKTTRRIYTDFSLCGEYIDYLKTDKYGDVSMRRSASAHDKLVEDLRQNISRHNHGRLYFGNGFYELRPDYNYLDRTNVYAGYNTYGNAYRTLYSATVTVKYSIQEIGTVLEDVFFKRTSVIGICLILVYIVFCVMNNRKLNS